MEKVITVKMSRKIKKRKKCKLQWPENGDKSVKKAEKECNRL